MNFERIVNLFLEDALDCNKNEKSCHMAILMNGKNKIYSHGFNQMDRHYFQGKCVTSLHAEVNCLSRIKIKTNNLKKYKLLVIKVSRHDMSFTDSRPCDICTELIREIGIKKVYCSNKNGTIEKLNMNNYIPEKITPRNIYPIY